MTRGQITRQVLILHDKKSLGGIELEAMYYDYKSKKAGREKLEYCNNSLMWI